MGLGWTIQTNRGWILHSFIHSFVHSFVRQPPSFSLPRLSVPTGEGLCDGAGGGQRGDGRAARRGQRCVQPNNQRAKSLDPFTDTHTPPPPLTACMHAGPARARVIPVEADEPHVAAGRRVSKVLRTLQRNVLPFYDFPLR